MFTVRWAGEIPVPADSQIDAGAMGTTVREGVVGECAMDASIASVHGYVLGLVEDSSYTCGSQRMPHQRRDNRRLDDPTMFADAHLAVQARRQRAPWSGVPDWDMDGVRRMDDHAGQFRLASTGSARSSTVWQVYDANTTPTSLRRAASKGSATYNGGATGVYVDGVGSDFRPVHRHRDPDGQLQRANAPRTAMDYMIDRPHPRRSGAPMACSWGPIRRPGPTIRMPAARTTGLSC